MLSFVEAVTLRKILNFIDRISEWTGRIFSCIIIILVILVVLEVILRKIFGSPTIWNFEVSKQLFACHFMMVSAFALLHKAHVSIDIVYEKFNQKTTFLDTTKKNTNTTLQTLKI